MWLAIDAGQLTGSFKVRGALLALETLPPDTHVVAASAGNHGAGVAYAAAELGLRATIVVPRSSPRAKTDKMRDYGATIVVVATDSYDDAEAEAKRMAAARHAVFVSPYDDLEVLAGNGASIAFEIASHLAIAPTSMIAPLGGGGLATGLACGLADAYGEQLGKQRRVWGAQSEASCAMALSLERGAAVEVLHCSGGTFADGLEGGISTAAYLRAGGVINGVVVVDEASIARAMVWANDVMNVRLEGSAAVALAPILDGSCTELRPEQDGVVVIVLTGRNVDEARFVEARAVATV